MDFTFLHTEVEAYAFFASLVFYIALVVIVLDKYNKIIRNKKLEQTEIKRRKKRVYMLFGIGLPLCGAIQYMLFRILFVLIPAKNPLIEPRSEYYLSVLVSMLIFLTIILFGIYLRGSSTLPRHEGPVSGV